MRLLLDVHLSGRVLAPALCSAGHDVVAANEDPHLARLDDDSLLQHVTSDRRLLITCNVRDFPSILREWAEQRHEHAGCVILVGIDHSEFGIILRTLAGTFQNLADQDAWRNLSRFVSRSDLR